MISWIVLVACQDRPGDLDRIRTAAETRDLRSADEMSAKYLAEHPNSAAALLARGYVLNRLERYGEALDLFVRAREFGAGGENYLLEYGLATLHAGDPQRAFDLLTQAAKSARHPGKALYLRGHARLKLKDWKGAAEDFEGAGNLEPSLRQACDLFRGRALQESGEQEEARRPLEEAKQGPRTDLARGAELLLRGARFGLRDDNLSLDVRFAVEPVQNAIFLGKGLAVPNDLDRRNDWRGVSTVDLRARLWSSGDWALSIADLFTNTTYAHIHEFNSNLNLLIGELRWERRPWVVRLLPEWDYETRDGDPLYSDLVISGGLDYYATEEWVTSLEARRSFVEYTLDVPSRALDRDGTATRVFLAQGYRDEARGLRVRIHGAFTRMVTEGDEYDADQFEVGWMVAWRLPFEFQFSHNGFVRWQDHDHPSVFSPGGPDRRDRVNRYAFELSRPILGPLALVVGYAWTENRSNLDEWTYTTSHWSFGVEYRY
jgi:tetratricopeptide (TPR) repeat protein